MALLSDCTIEVGSERSQYYCRSTCIRIISSGAFIPSILGCSAVLVPGLGLHGMLVQFSFSAYIHQGSSGSMHIVVGVSLTASMKRGRDATSILWPPLMVVVVLTETVVGMSSRRMCRV